MLKTPLILLAFLIGFVDVLHTQDTLKTLTPKQRKNELGLDMTPFIKFYANFTGNLDEIYRPVYYLTYRHYFKKLNIRAAVGGNYSSGETASPYDINQDEIYLRNEKTFEFRLGVESFQPLGRRWQVFYGIDVRTSQFEYYNEAVFFNGGYANGQHYTMESIGLAPLLGIRFKITDRLSLLTESSWMLEFSKNTFQPFTTPIDPVLPPLEEEKLQTHKIIRSVFSHPISLVLAVTF